MVKNGLDFIYDNFENERQKHIKGLKLGIENLQVTNKDLAQQINRYQDRINLLNKYREDIANLKTNIAKSCQEMNAIWNRYQTIKNIEGCEFIIGGKEIPSIPEFPVNFKPTAKIKKASLGGFFISRLKD